MAVDDVPALATSSGVRSVILELKPRHNVVTGGGSQNGQTAASQTSAIAGDTFNKLGLAFDQGVTQHRVDQINQFYNPSAAFDYEGQGMSIGFISDSYDNRTSKKAAADVASFDLPGSPNNPVNTQPVVVLQDLDGGGTDEGRAMVQIGYKMAPKARTAFATADLGEVGFANNIRALAGIPGFTYPGQDFAADSICDDVGYFDEPYFQDGIIGQGVNDAATFGVAYFSSAGNDIGTTGYESDLRWVANGSGTTPGTNSALVGTNINLANVPASAYAGGFHNFNPNPNQLDVAQTVNIASNGSEPFTALEWNDPYDQNTEPDKVEPPIFTGSGSITSPTDTAGVSFVVPATLTQGTLYEVDSDAIAGSSFDSIVTIFDPSNNIILGPQDTEVDEVARFIAPVTGSGYTIKITACCNTVGGFDVTMYSTTGFSGQTISTDVNLLVFDMEGNYLPGSSLVTNNFATNEPIELGQTFRATGETQVQYVISRSNVPASGGADHVRYLISGDGIGGIGPAEYLTYNTITTGGHPMAAGANGTAAYSVFRPSLPETYTSPGGVKIYFDANGNRLALPEVRRQPTIAAADAANTSFFSGDTSADPDTNPNFSGTSAAGPHAAAIAALVLQAHGGHRSVTPAQMTKLLERSTFPHDLDPSYASGVARTTAGDIVTVQVLSDASTSAGQGGNDANTISVSYKGTGNLSSLVFNPTGSALTAGNVSGGNNGIQDITPATTPPHRDLL